MHKGGWLAATTYVVSVTQPRVDTWSAAAFRAQPRELPYVHLRNISILRRASPVASAPREETVLSFLRPVNYFPP